MSGVALISAGVADRAGVGDGVGVGVFIAGRLQAGNAKQTKRSRLYFFIILQTCGWIAGKLIVDESF